MAIWFVASSAFANVPTASTDDGRIAAFDVSVRRADSHLGNFSVPESTTVPHKAAPHYGRASTPKERWARFKWDVRNLADRDVNPFVLAGEGDLKPKRRSALTDITHAFKNLFVPNKAPRSFAPDSMAK